jgi:hypothetical protein
VNGITHPYSKDVYERDDAADGTPRVRVTLRNGLVGWFDHNGRWLDGEKFEADLHLCGWIAAPRGAHRLNTASH